MNEGNIQASDDDDERGDDILDLLKLASQTSFLVL